jgi:hypothetical protein
VCTAACQADVPAQVQCVCCRSRTSHHSRSNARAGHRQPGCAPTLANTLRSGSYTLWAVPPDRLGGSAGGRGVSAAAAPRGGPFLLSRGGHRHRHQHRHRQARPQGQGGRPQGACGGRRGRPASQRAGACTCAQRRHCRVRMRVLSLRHVLAETPVPRAPHVSVCLRVLGAGGRWRLSWSEGASRWPARPPGNGSGKASRHRGSARSRRSAR